MKKRANGEGSVTHVRGDRWRLRMTVPGTPQRRLSKTVRSKTKREAQNALREWAAEVAQELHLEPGKTTVAGLMEEWLRHLEGNKSPTTIRRYRTSLENHVVPRIGTLAVRDLTTRRIDALYASMAETCSPNTIVNVHTALMSMTRQAKRWRMVAAMPEPTLPRVRGVERDVPTPDVVRRLIEKAEELELPHVALLIRVAAKTGARRGELCGLQVSDLDWDAGTLTIRRQIQSHFGELPVKGYHSRVVALSAGLQEEIQEYLGHERETWQREPGPWLISKDGGLHPVANYSIWQGVRTVAEACGVKVTPHSFRHFHSSYGVAAGVDPVTMAKRSGHSVDVAMRTYMHRVREADVRAAEALETVLRGEVQEVLPPT